MNQTEACLEHKKEENCQYDHVRLNLQGITNPFLQVYIVDEGNINKYLSDTYLLNNNRKPDPKLRIL